MDDIISSALPYQSNILTVSPYRRSLCKYLVCLPSQKQHRFYLASQQQPLVYLSLQKQQLVYFTLEKTRWHNSFIEEICG